jgi:hypothetical protein
MENYDNYVTIMAVGTVSINVNSEANVKDVVQRFLPEAWEYLREDVSLNEIVGKRLLQIFPSHKIHKKRVFPKIKVNGQPLVLDYYVQKPRLAILVLPNRSHPLLVYTDSKPKVRHCEN